MDDLRWRDFCLKTKTRPSVAWGNAKGNIKEPIPKHGETDDLRWRDYKTSGLVKQGIENWTKYIPGGAVSNLDMRILNESRNLNHAMSATEVARPSTAHPDLLKIIHDLKHNAAKLRGEIQDLKSSRQQNETTAISDKKRTKRNANLVSKSLLGASRPMDGDMTLEHHLICQHERESKVKRQLGESGEPLCKEIMKGTFYHDSRDPCIVDPYRLKKKFLMAPGPGVSAQLGLDSTLRNIKYQEMATQSTTVCADIVQGRFMLESEGKHSNRASSEQRNYIQANAKQASLSYLKLKCDRSKYDEYFPQRASDSFVQQQSVNSESKAAKTELTPQQKKRSNEILLSLSEKVSQKRGGDQMLWRIFQEVGSGKVTSITSGKELSRILATFQILPSQDDIGNLVAFLRHGLKENRITFQLFRLRLEQSHLK
jgi:hypothetical protein